jgi:hypothetical protein
MKMDLEEMGWIQLCQDGIKWPAIMATEKKFRFHKRQEIFKCFEQL